MIFKRSPLLLVVAAMMALSGLFVHDAPPASADHDEVTTVWSATMTVQDLTGISALGCDNAYSGGECSTTSALTNDDFTYTDFTHRDVDYEVEIVTVSSNILVFGLDKAIPSGFLTLNVGGTEFSLASGTAANSNKNVQWTNSGISWSAGDTVSLSLAAGPPPSGVELSTDKLEINEDSTGSGAFTVALSADPGASTTVTLVRTQFFQSEYGESGHVWDLNAATVSPETLTFTSGASGNWNTAQTVTVTGVEDDDGCDEQLLILVLVQTAAADGNTQPEYEPVGGSGSSVTGVFVTVDDDDTVGCGGI